MLGNRLGLDDGRGPRNTEEWFRAVLQVTLDPLFILQAPSSPSGRIEDFVVAEANAAAAEWSRRERDALIGEPLARVLPTDMFAPVIFRCLRVYETRLPLEEEVRSPGSPPLRFECRIAPLHRGLALVFRELPAEAPPPPPPRSPSRPGADSEDKMRASLKEKETLLKEIHHRVKNNLQVIASLLNLQAAHVPDAIAYEMFQESQNRVRSIALFHEKLYQSRDLVRIDVADYLRDLVSSLTGTFGPRAAQVEIAVEAENVLVDVESAVPCGLIANELITNALKHAFGGGRRGRVVVSFRVGADGECVLGVEDDGVGLPATIDLPSVQSLGLQIVGTLAEQIGGTVGVERTGGTRFRVRFPAS